MRRIYMTKIAVIIPSRLSAERLPNKPLSLINNKEMILHVYEKAVNSEVGEVFVATPDKAIEELIKKNGGSAILTRTNHPTGTDRIFEAVEKKFDSKPEIIINLQGDMPNIDSESIILLANQMLKRKNEIATLASKIENKEIKDKNIVKVKTKFEINQGIFSNAIDFFRITNDTSNENIYHHIGIYAFTFEALLRYVNLKISRNLEQMRALENKMKISVGYINSFPLSVDTKEDIEKIRLLMKEK